MVRKDDVQYLLLDGMPYVVTPEGKNYVFGKDKVWEPHSGANFDAVFPNFANWWKEKFEALPELPA